MEVGKRQLALDDVVLVTGEHGVGNWVRPGRIQKVGQGDQVMGELSSRVGMQDGQAQHRCGAQDHETLQSTIPGQLVLGWGGRQVSPGLQGPAPPRPTFLLGAFSCWDAHPSASAPRELRVSAVLCAAGLGDAVALCPCVPAGLGHVSLSRSTRLAGNFSVTSTCWLPSVMSCKWAARKEMLVPLLVDIPHLNCLFR